LRVSWGIFTGMWGRFGSFRSVTDRFRVVLAVLDHYGSILACWQSVLGPSSIFTDPFSVCSRSVARSLPVRFEQLWIVGGSTTNRLGSLEIALERTWSVQPVADSLPARSQTVAGPFAVRSRPVANPFSDRSRTATWRNAAQWSATNRFGESGEATAAHVLSVVHVGLWISPPRVKPVDRSRG
jgi:hypothetical protein